MPIGKAPITPSAVINLEVDFDGTILVNGAVMTGYDQLESYFRNAARQDPQPELHVLPDRRASYDSVAHVLGIAQRSGIQRIGFAGNEKFME